MRESPGGFRDFGTWAMRGTSYFRDNCDDVGASWAARSKYWIEQAPSRVRPKRRVPERHPLILAGHGVRLRVENGALHIRGGLTHYPQEPEVWRFFPGDLNMPSRIIMVDGSGGLSFDVMGWLSEQNVPLIRIDWQGNVTSIVGNAIPFDPDKVVAQRAADPLPIAISLISQKLENSIQTLIAVIPNSEIRENAISRIQADKFELENFPPRSIDALLGIEGRGANSYFSGWQGIPIKWKGILQRPIPDDWHFVGPRQSAVGGKKGKNKRASHPVNAMLNYAYAILENQVRTGIVSNGYDPSIGYLHSGDPERHALVFDLMEPLRPTVDREVLRLVQLKNLLPHDFSIRSDGVCRLNPEFARYLARIVSAVEPKQYGDDAQVHMVDKLGKSKLARRT